MITELWLYFAVNNINKCLSVVGAQDPGNMYMNTPLKTITKSMTTLSFTKHLLTPKYTMYLTVMELHVNAPAKGITI